MAKSPPSREPAPTNNTDQTTKHMKSKLFLATAMILAAATDPAAPEGGGAAAAPVAPPKPAREKQNGVTRPSPGTATGNVWQIADGISAANNRPALRAEVTEAGAAAGINPATVTTQFGQWRRFYGIKKEVTVAVAAATGTEPAKKPAKGKKAAAAAATTSNVPDGGVAVVTTEGGEVEEA